jgi:diguanylate cyclase (GGDEF)-like protein
MIAIEGYNISEHLSQSPTTGIYRGERLSDHMPVILKILDIEFPSSIQLARIRHEYELVKKITHSGVIKAHSLEKFNHSLAIVMEDFGGVPLRALITERALSIEEKLKIALRISEILGDIHRDGIIHKDLNPNNILINSQTGEVRIIDFGNATQFVHEDQQLIHPDQLEGTLAYIAPEQTGRMNRPVDYRSDYYSLGITLYELLLNRPPFEAQDSMEMIHMHLASVPPRLHSTQPSIPVIASRIVQKLIEKNAENRYQSAIGICKDLETCILALSSATSTEDFIPGTKDSSDRFSIPSTLYGRDAEIKQLMDAYERVCDGKPGIVLVTGYSGIGKSSLIHEIHKPIAKRRGIFISGKFDQFRRNVPYSALVQAFQNLLHQILTESDERIVFWRERILAALGENSQVIVEVIPELRHILGDQAIVQSLSPQEAQNRFNYYFVKFVQVFAQAEHPLTLFLDDLQWADHPSLNVIELLSTHCGSAHQMIIGAYRQNEVDATHPLQLALTRIGNGGTWIDEIALKSLAPEVVCQIIADTFCCDTDAAQALAELVCRKTDGNPFFINQLLKNLYETKLVSYDDTSRNWVWDIAEIDRVGISENVIELMTANIRKLPAATQHLMNLAACIGNQFTLEVLSVVSEKTRDVIAEDFHIALQAGLIVPIGNEYKFFGNTASSGDRGPREFDVQYRFQHDRIQQAAYDLLSAQEKTNTHFKMGNLLLENTSDVLAVEKIFDIVDHFNQSIALATDPALRLRLAKLNVKASSRAKNAIAYESALQYITIARDFLDDIPHEDRPLLFHLLAERAECEHLNGHNEAAEKFYQEAQNQAKTQDEQAMVLEAMIHFYTNTGNFKLAYHTGRQALRIFGVSLPAGFIPPLFVADLVRAKWGMRGRKIADLIELPICHDANLRTAMRLIGALLKAAYQIRPELCIACAVKAVNLSLKHGTTEDNAVAYVVFGGIFIGGVMGKHQAGYEFGKLALAMNDRFGNLKQRSEVNFVSGYFTDFWLKPAQNTEKYYRAAYESGLQTGDFFHLSCAACTLIESQYIRGVSLAEVKQLGGDYLVFMERIKSQEAAGAITATLRAILNLQGVTESPVSFGDSDFNEAQFVERIQGFTSLHFSHFYFINKMQTLYLWGKYDEALEVAQTSEQYLKYSLAMLHTVEHYFYHALILCAAYDSTINTTHLAKARKILKKFEQWAHLNPANFAHKALLIRAEIERLSSGGWEVADLYAKAIQSADESGYQQNKALCNELAGRFFASKNIEEAARSHIRKAYYGYHVWGAQGIADKLAREFPQAASLRKQDPLSGAGLTESSRRIPSLAPVVNANRSAPHSASFNTTSSSRRKSGLDLETVIKSTQAISSEIKLSTLLQKLMKIMIENAGAEKGSFIRVEQGQLQVEAEGLINEEEVRILGGTPLDGAKLPVSLVKYVARLGESIVLNDAPSDTRFWDDPYIAQTQPKSLLCAPVIHQGRVIGVVCLENSLTSGAFTPGRLELLKMLSAQAAISIENSLLYANLEQRVQERTQELSQATEELQAANESLEKLSYLDALTQISNKRQFQRVYEDEWKRAERFGLLLTIMLIDIDHFKLYNDTYGHVEGDRCLKLVAGALNKAVCRTGDLVARFGGEEFIVLLPNTNIDDARLIAMRLVESVRELAIPHEASLAGTAVSISLGLAQTIPQQIVDGVTLINAADKALYQAKTNGRNRFCES